MKIVSWNINSIGTTRQGYFLKKGTTFSQWMINQNADLICLQETKVSKNLLPNVEGYNLYTVPPVNGRNHGVATYSKNKPLNIIKGLNHEILELQARVLTLEFDNLYICNAYFPMAWSPENRNYQEIFIPELLRFLAGLIETKKQVILCGDFNIAHTKQDLFSPKSQPGYRLYERKYLDEILNLGFVDSYRFLHKDGRMYTRWSDKNKLEQGWRIDYIFITEKLTKYLKEAGMETERFESDHTPIYAIIDINL